jgi:glycosyltransferase involved in cell wall biosynthesis
MADFVAAFGRPDLIHAHVVLPAGWAAVQLGRRMSIPVLLTEHSSPFSMHLSTAVTRALARRALIGAAAVIAVSPSLAEQIRAFVGSVRPYIIGEVIRTGFFVPSGDQHRNSPGHLTTFLTVAIISPQKGIPNLLRAVRMLLDRGHREFRVIIGGDGPQRAHVERMRKSLEIFDFVEFAGAMSQSEVRASMQRCDVFVLPSLHETFGVVLGEAMACGKPVIATRCGGPEFTVTPETGTLVQPGDPLALANAMEQHLQGRLTFDPSAIRRSVTERFGDDAFVEKLSEVYAKVWLK